MLLRLISAAFLASYVSCNMTISTSQNYYIQYQTLEINCTSTVTVYRNLIFISCGEYPAQVSNIIYHENTCKRLVNGIYIKCGDECRCTLNGKSIAYYYNVTMDTPTLKLTCHTLYVSLTGSMVIKKAVEPSKAITIYSEPESYVNESMSIMLQCRVNGGHPLANITWSCNGRQITTKHVTAETFVVGKTNMTLYKEDNNRECTCTADHFLWKEPPSITGTKRLNVFFAPQSDVILTGLQPNITTLYEYDSLNATCSINGGNPLPNVIFTCGTLEGNVTLINAFVTAVIKTNVYRSFDKIQCICIAKHILLLEEISRRVFLQVYYTPSKPTLSFVPSTPLLEGQFLKMKCETTDKGNPPIHMYQWHSHSDNNSTKEEVYNYGQVTKDDNNIHFYCSVINKYTEYKNIRLESKKTLLNVEYEPWIDVTEKNLTIVEGQPTFAMCTANGNPEPKVHWKFEGISIGEETELKSELRFHLTNRNQHGVYTCFAKAMSIYHGELNSSVNIFLTVNYAPSIFAINGKVDYNENENGSIQCNVDGKPTPKLKWLFVEGLQTTLLSTRHDLVFINTKCLEMGLYRCVAKNIEGDDVSKVTIIVKCTPRLNTIEYTVKEKVIVRINQPLNLSVPIIAYPIPRLYWQFKQSHYVTNISNGVTNKHFVNRHVSSLIIQNMTKEKFGLYILYGENGLKNDNANQQIGYFVVEEKHDTVNNISNTKSSLSYLAGIGTGIGIAVLVFSISVVTAGVVWFRRKRMPDSSNIYQETERQDSGTNVYNELNEIRKDVNSGYQSQRENTNATCMYEDISKLGSHDNGSEKPQTQKKCLS